MKAYQLEAYEGPSGLVLAQVESPMRGEDELLVEVHAIGVNFPDLLLTRGQYQLKPELPFVPGCEIAGTVIEAPLGSGWGEGDRISAFIWQGGYAEQAVVPVAVAAPVDRDVTMQAAAAMIVNYHTALFALDRRTKLKPGEIALILGAGGGIGSAAVQVAKGLGARVVAGVADVEQAAIAKHAGADEVVLLERGYSAAVRTLLGRGVDVVADPLGDWLFDEAVRCLEPEGRIAVIGFAAGRIPSVAVNRLLLRNVSVVGAAFGAFLDSEPDLVSRQAVRIAEFVKAGTVVPQIDGVYPFGELPRVLERLGRGEVRGKAVVTLK